MQKRMLMVVVAIALLVSGLLAGCRRAPRTEYLENEVSRGPYSGAVLTGDIVFISGKIGSQNVGDFEAEVHVAMDAVEDELQRVGLGITDLVQVTVYLSDINLYGRFNEVYASRVPAPRPARACVAVAGLPGDANVEIVAVAKRKRPLR